MIGDRIITMREALEDPAYFGSSSLLGGDSWLAWRVLLIAAMGEALTDAERVVFADLTGRDHEPCVAVEELWGIIGRRGGKSRAIAALVVYLACFVDYRHTLAPGQIGLVPVIAASKDQATEIYRYCIGLIETVDCLSALLADKPTTQTIALTTRINISIRTASFRTARSFTAVAVVLDELAFFHSGESSANPDTEIVTAVRFALATTRGPLIAISSPYARRGELWNAFRRHYGSDGDARILVAKAPSKTMNPTLDAAFIAREFEKDPVAARSELDAEFRTDVDGFVSDEVVAPCINHGAFELPPDDGIRYVAFVDPSSGTGSDSMTLAIAYREADGRAVLAYLAERSPRFNPEQVAEDFSITLKRFRLSTVTGDRYAKGWVANAFQRHGVTYREAELNRSEIYRDFVPLLTTGKALLLDNAKLKNQLLALERTTGPTGKDTINHPPGGHDDVINAAAGAMVYATRRRPMNISADFIQRSAVPLAFQGVRSGGFYEQQPDNSLQFRF